LICISLREPDYQSFVAALSGLEMAEIRMDGAKLSPAEVESIFSRPLVLVATFRPGGVRLKKRAEMLSLAIRAGARFVDLELQSPPAFRDELVKAARASRCRVIISYHNDRKTPDRPLLEQIADRCFRAGADIAKLACRVHSQGDCARLLSLYDQSRPIIALGLGRLGIMTRIVAPSLGAPFTYASLAPGRQTADGQLDWKAMREKIRALGG